DDIEWIGGESCITETVGLGGVAPAAAVALQGHQGGPPPEMGAVNEGVDAVTGAGHPRHLVPLLPPPGAPPGVDGMEGPGTGAHPGSDGGLAGRDGVGQIGAGILKAPIECFAAARAAYVARYGEPAPVG